MELSEFTWAAIGAAITAIGMIVVGVFKAKSEANLGMTTEQRLMLESVFNQVQAQSSTIDALHRDISSQRVYYETLLDDLRTNYRKEIQDQESHCQLQLTELRGEIERLNRLMC